MRELRIKNLKILLALEISFLLITVAGIATVSKGENLYNPLHELLGVSLGILITTLGLYKIDQLT